jgi:hypothetical protein
VISKLLALKNCTFLAIYILRDESPYILGRWWSLHMYVKGIMPNSAAVGMAREG